MKKLLLGALGALLLAAGPALADGYFPFFPQAGGQPNTVCTNNVNGVCLQFAPAGPPVTGAETVPGDTHLPSGQQPQTVNIPTSALTLWNNPKNLLGNAQLRGTQVNGTGTVTFATTGSPTTAALVADRWVGDVNVTSGAGRSAIVTTGPTPPVGFQQSVQQWRNSGSLAQPICSWQQVPTPQSTQLAGQTVTLSVYAQALSALAADNGSQINLVVITGTGTDQGFNGAWTASPAITPAWTGIATAVNSTQTITTAWTRVFATAVIPAAATEIGVGICFTPTTGATGNSTPTDGFNWVGAQLEKGTVPSVFEVRAAQADILDNEQFIYKIAEGALGPSRSVCHFTTANTAMQCPIVFPVQMYKAPTMTYATGFAGFTTSAETTANACTGNTTDATVALTPSTTQVMMQCAIASGTTAAVGLSMTLIDNGGTGTITAWTGL